MKKLVPSYSWFPILGTVILNMITYYGTRLVPNRQYVNISLSIDEMIPLVPGMIFIYVFAFATWFLGLWLVAHDREERCCRLFAAEQIAKFICLLFFVFLPTNMVRPTVEVKDFSTGLMNLIYTIDSPDNLFPSLHCLENWILFRAIRSNEKMPGWVKAFYGVYAVLVFVSVVTVKQHLVLDIVGAVTVVEFSLFLSAKLHVGELYRKLNRRLNLNEKN